MRFLTNQTESCMARIGTLTEFNRFPNARIETPLVLIYTKRGGVPHLTKDVFNMVTTQQHLLSVSLPSTIAMAEAIKDINISFGKFVSMGEYINFLSIQDPAEAVRKGFQQGEFIPVWTRTGRNMLTAKAYMDIVEAFKPDLYMVLCDGLTDVDSGIKRTRKAVHISKTLLEQCLDRHNNSEALKSTGILGAVEGGYNLEARTESINALKDKPLLGYVIDGLHNNGPDVRHITIEVIKEVMMHTVSLLAVDKLKVSMGCWNPVTVLDLVALGVDVFDTSYPYIATENSQALTFLCDHDACNNVGHMMYVAEKQYREDVTPICSECQCLTCQNHTRAYLHHLHHTKEMLRSVLLMIHNTHQYLKFFDAIRQNIKNGTLSEYRQKISSKFTISEKDF